MRIPVLLALAAAALFGTATPLGKLLLGSLDPFTLAGLFYLGAALALAPRALRRGPEGAGLAGKLRAAGRRNRLLVAGSILAGGFAGPVLLLFGLRAAASMSVSLWLNLEMVATAALGHFVFRDRMTRRSSLAAAGVLAASALLSLGGGQSGPLGGLLVAAACLAWGFDNHFTALVDALKPEESTFLKGAVAGTVNLAIGLAASGGDGLRPATVAAALAIGALSYGASIVLYISAAQGLGASRAQLWFSSSPVFGLALAALALGERFDATRILAMAIMTLSYAALFSERHAHGHAHEADSHTHWHRHGEGHHEHAHASLPAFERLFGHAHGHAHAARSHSHAHVSDIHHRHGHGDGAGEP
ncbi:MAG TPA: DMT family transporter [Spirochaetales bacterium]|nr:DMT family transporter [Spirochaetales bacterium]